MTAIYTGRWDCKSCGLKGNIGPDTQCAGCGSPRPKDVLFYLPENAEEEHEQKVEYDLWMKYKDGETIKADKSLIHIKVPSEKK